MKRIISMSLVLALAIVFTTILGGCGKVDVEDITLSDKTVKLQLKDKFELSATVTPKNAAEPMVYWDSSDSSVVTSLYFSNYRNGYEDDLKVFSVVF